MELEKLDNYITLLDNTTITKDDAKQLIALLDLTSLGLNDTKYDIAQLCAQASTPYGKVAAICIYPQFVSQAKQCLINKEIKVATVCNFPSGTKKINESLDEIRHALDQGADEIDMVMPHQDYVIGDHTSTKQLVAAAKTLCDGAACLKVILEVGVLSEQNKIYQASLDVIAAGADFIKTSTGKVPGGATIPAAFAMLSAIKESKRQVGFKAAGGVRSVREAVGYIILARQLLGDSYIHPKTFRIGTSSLLAAILDSSKQ